MPRLAVGDLAPPLNLPDQHGNRVSLADFRGRPVLIYFYPRADTPGCTRQSCAVRDARDQWRQFGLTALGVSPDGGERLAKFDRKYDLGFTLLSDADHAVAAAYGAWGEKKLYGKVSQGILRSSFLVGADGRLRGVWYRVKPEATVPNALAVLAGNGDRT